MGERARNQRCRGHEERRTSEGGKPKSDFSPLPRTPIAPCRCTSRQALPFPGKGAERRAWSRLGAVAALLVRPRVIPAVRATPPPPPATENEDTMEAEERKKMGPIPSFPFAIVAAGTVVAATVVGDHRLPPPLRVRLFPFPLPLRLPPFPLPPPPPLLRVSPMISA